MMQSISLIPIVVVVSICLISQLALADDVIINKKDKKPKPEDDRPANEDMKVMDKSEKTKTLKDYFELEGISVDDSELTKERVSRYDDEVISKMAQLLAIDNDYYKSHQLNGEINYMIYNGLARGNSLKVEAPFELADEAILQTLDLIVPNSDSEEFYSLAKKDLRLFFVEHPDLGRELIERISVSLDMGELQTRDAIQFLEGAYYNWIPLARLADYIEENGSDRAD